MTVLSMYGIAFVNLYKRIENIDKGRSVLLKKTFLTEPKFMEI